MRKIFSLMIIGILILTIFGAVISSSSNNNKILQKLTIVNTMIISELFPSADEFEIVNERNGQKIKNDNYNYLMELGKPVLPCKNI